MENLPRSNDIPENYNTKEFKTLLGFISGSTIGSFSDDQISMELDEDTESYHTNKSSRNESFINEEQWSSLGFSIDFDRSTIPTFQGVASRIEKESGVILDTIQYVAYEIICASFMLNLVIERWYAVLMFVHSR